MAGTPLKNLRVFKKLCGNNAMAQVFLVTTMWDEVEEDVGVERLNELKSTYWKGMVSRGSTVVEYRNTWDSATKLLDDATRRSSERRHVTLQKEISELKMELRETEAGQQLCSRLEDLADQRLQTLRKLREEQSKSGDPRSTEELRKEYTELRAQLDDTLKQVHALRLPLRKRAAEQLRKIFSTSSDLRQALYLTLVPCLPRSPQEEIVTLMFHLSLESLSSAGDYTSRSLPHSLHTLSKWWMLWNRRPLVTGLGRENKRC